MNIFTYIKQDHQKVSDLFEMIVSNPESSENEDLIAKIIEELTVHAETEQATFYKAMNKTVTAKEEVTESKDEHKDIKNAIAKVMDSSVNTPAWYIAVGELKGIVEHHVKEEETKMFKTAKKVISKSKADALVEEMEELKNEMRETEA